MVDTCGFEAAKGYMPNEYGHQKAFFIISSPGTYCVSENMLWWLHDTQKLHVLQKIVNTHPYCSYNLI